MTELAFTARSARADPEAATPTVLLGLRVQQDSDERVEAIAARCQIRIEPARRTYTAAETDGVADLFGPRSQWGRSLKPLQLATVPMLVPGFVGGRDFEVPLPCSYDFDVAANKYLYAVRDGYVPLLLLFSGSVFSVPSVAAPASGPTPGPSPGAKPGDGTRPAPGPGSRLSVSPVSWQCECRFQLPVAVWREAMDRHFPGTAWLRLDRETFDALYRYRAAAQLLGWDEAVLRLLEKAGT